MNSSSRRKVKIFGAPVDLGSKKLGVEMGPTAIRHAGLHEALRFNGVDYEDYGDLAIDVAAKNNGYLKEIVRVSEKLAALVNEATSERFVPVILGGDHSVSIGSIAGASQGTERLGVLWLDCHPDANTPESSPTGNIHGMTVAISLGYGHPELVNIAGFSPKILPEDIFIIGAKDIDRQERVFLDKLGVSLFTLIDIEKRGIAGVLDQSLEKISRNCTALHVSFDVDVLDPIIAPGTGISSRGGLSYREILCVMDTLGKSNEVCSMDIIEINPLLDNKNQTSELSIELLLAVLGGSYGDYERNYLK